MIKPEPDRRTWRYRQGESKIFHSPESVPEGQGWVDCPSKVAAVRVDEPAILAEPDRKKPGRKPREAA